MVSPTPPALPVNGGDRDVWGPKVNAYLQWASDSVAEQRAKSTLNGPTQVSGSVTVDFGTGAIQFLDLTGDVTNTTLTNIPDSGGAVQVWVRQAGSGGYLFTWPSGIHWPGGTAPVVTANLGRLDIYSFRIYSGGLYFTSSAQGLQ